MGEGVLEEQAPSVTTGAVSQKEACTPVAVLATADNQKQFCRIQEALFKDSVLADKDKKSVVVLGNLWSDAAHSTVCGYLVHLLRQHGLHGNERQMVVSQADSAVIVQLCLAEIQKETLGYDDVLTSDVIELQRHLVRDKLGLLGDGTQPSQGDTYLQVRSRYDAFLSACNLLDWSYVLERVTRELPNNATLAAQLNDTSFLLCNCSADPVEHAMVRLLVGSKPCHVLSAGCIDDSVTSPSADDVTVQEGNVEEWLGAAQGRPQATPGAQASASQAYTERALVSYLHLLVNSRSELALAAVFNVPNRKLDAHAFTALKHAARERKLSMYQTAASLVMRLRLGGRGYQLDSACALAQHVKGIAELTDLTHKLTNIIEDETDTRKACCRVLNALRNAVVRCRDETLRRASVEAATDRLQRLVTHTLDLHEEGCLTSPGRDADNGSSLVGRHTLRALRTLVDTHASRVTDAHNGGSLVGRHTLRALRTLVDTHASRVTVTSQRGGGGLVGELTDRMSSQHTPQRLPALASHFRSPAALESPGQLSLEARAQARLASTPKTGRCAVPRFGAALDWAVPSDFVPAHELEQTTLPQYVPSKTLVCAGVRPSARRVLESLHDQENQIPLSTAGSCQENQTQLPTAGSCQEGDSAPLCGSQDPLTCSQNNTELVGKTKPEKVKMKLGQTKVKLDENMEKGNNKSGKGRKRKGEESGVEEGNGPAKKRVTGHGVTGSNKTKTKPLLKGQKTLTAFFRV